MTLTMSDRFVINFLCKQKNLIYMYLAPWNGFKTHNYTKLMNNF